MRSRPIPDLGDLEVVDHLESMDFTMFTFKIHDPRGQIQRVGTPKWPILDRFWHPFFEGSVKTVSGPHHPSVRQGTFWWGAYKPFQTPQKGCLKRVPKWSISEGPRSTPWVEVDPPPENDLPIYILSRARGVGVGREKSRFLDRKMTHFWPRKIGVFLDLSYRRGEIPQKHDLDLVQKVIKKWVDFLGDF